MGLTSLRVAIAQDSSRFYPARLQHLTREERALADALPTELRRHQFVIGHLAARTAIRHVLGARFSSDCIEIASGPDHEPHVIVNGVMDLVGVSVSDSSRLAVACAWLTKSEDQISAGIDLERIRPTEIENSPYAFSRRERKAFLRTAEGPKTAALAAWTAKEAVWKALRADQKIGPDAICIKQFSLEKGYASVQVRGRLANKLANSQLSVTSCLVDGPDGQYVLSLARVIPPKGNRQHDTSISLLRAR